MNDYLGRLGERALGIADLVQPAIAPLFANERSAIDLLESDERNHRNQDTRKAVSRLEESTVAEAVPGSAAILPTMLQSGREDSGNLVSPVREAKKSRRAVGINLSQSEVVQKSGASLATKGEMAETDKARQLAPDRRTVRLQADGGQIAPQRHTVRLQLSENSHAATSSASDMIAYGDHISSINQPEKHVDEDIEVGSVSSTPISLTRHRAPPREAKSHELGAHDEPNDNSQRLTAQLRSLGKSDTSQLDQHPTSPVVRVNIGRIEVRAIQSPVAAAPLERRGPARPTMALTDYLMKKPGAHR